MGRSPLSLAGVAKDVLGGPGPSLFSSDAMIAATEAKGRISLSVEACIAKSGAGGGGSVGGGIDGLVIRTTGTIAGGAGGDIGGF